MGGTKHRRLDGTALSLVYSVFWVARLASESRTTIIAYNIDERYVLQIKE
jgi:hypothetical protein